MVSPVPVHGGGPPADPEQGTRCPAAPLVLRHASVVQHGHPCQAHREPQVAAFQHEPPSCPARIAKQHVIKHFETHALFAKGSRRSRFTVDSNCDLTTAPKMLDRQFSIAQPYKSWVRNRAYRHLLKKIAPVPIARPTQPSGVKP